MDYRKYLASLEKFGINLGLKRISHLLEKLDNPQERFLSIHIAGTNGKGSTAAMIASILKETGYKVGLYTSPHILDYTERIKINGKDINKKELSAALEKVKIASRGMKAKPTIFEALTAAAFYHFARKKVQVAVVEVGLGGRLDATNVLSPLITVITNIELEHTEILGKTLKKIAAEKAAIIKPGVPVITAETKAEPLEVITVAAEKARTMLLQVQGYDSTNIPNLIGDYQKLNAACAVAAVRLSGLNVTHDQVTRGLRKTEWPGRFQIISQKPLIIVDGAHNPAGMKALRQAIQHNFWGKYTVIFGCQKTKDHQGMLKELEPVIKELIITRSSHKQAQDPVKIGQGHIAHSLAEAVERWDQKRPLLVTGSIFLVADLMKLLTA